MTTGEFLVAPEQKPKKPLTEEEVFAGLDEYIKRKRSDFVRPEKTELVETPRLNNPDLARTLGVRATWSTPSGS